MFLALLRRKAIVICFYSLVLFVVMFIIVLRLRLIQFKNISFLSWRLFVFAYLFLKEQDVSSLFFSSLAIEVSCHESDLKKVQQRIWMPRKEIKNSYEKHSLLILTELGIFGNIYINTVPKREILSCNFLPDILLLALLFHLRHLIHILVCKQIWNCYFQLSEDIFLLRYLSHCCTCVNLYRFQFSCIGQ